MLKKIAEREEKEKVMQFLMGLNEPYSQIRGSILMMNPMPDTRKAHGLILQQERQMEVAARNSTMSASHAMQVARRGGSQTVTSFGSKKFCTHCEQGGHLVDQCYYLIGFPIGHKWHGKNVKPRNKKTTINNIEVKRESANESPTFTAEEYKQIMALLKNGNNQPFANATVYSRRPQPTDIIPSDPPITTPHSPVPPMDPSVTPLTNITEPPMVDPIQILPEPRHSTRLHRPPPYLQDFQTYHATVLGPDVSSASMSSTRYPLQRYVSYSGLSSPYRSFVGNISRLVEPATYEQARHDSQYFLVKIPLIKLGIWPNKLCFGASCQTLLAQYVTNLEQENRRNETIRLDNSNITITRPGQEYKFLNLFKDSLLSWLKFCSNSCREIVGGLVIFMINACWRLNMLT
ncbi:hypothetical protein DKX38_004970 [Salix brachista]|uniref:Uncharacterized protein n=1 Tax=Salix brachista TaxID=2182728 RepID=A0A5N5NER8_9ROSI|nr:hypothetical protein DKX38_004970 [Salix brachista]